MCGIVAIVSGAGPVSADALDRAVASLDHRGPDARGTWIASHGRSALGHTRLSIIDLEGGDQPIANEDEQIRIVVNGEFYGYEAVQRELTQAGHRLRTRSDSEIALHLYEDLGARCVDRLRGEFAFAIWDERERKLLAFRDRYGVKPLFYSFHDGNLYVASEMKALFAAGVPARWDRESVCFGPALRRPDRTPFEGVRTVPPGHYLVADAKGFEVVQYWDVVYPTTDDEPPCVSETDHAEGLRSVLDEAVRIRLRADVPVGCYLSGGVDSCAILGLAAKHRSDPIRAFTVRFDHEDYDEGEIASEMAASAGAEFTPIAVTGGDLADNFADAVFHAEGPCTNAHGVAKYLLSRRVRDAGFKVVLTGEGADEVLAGYPHFVHDMLLNDASQDPATTKRLIKELVAAHKAAVGFALFSQEGLGSAMMRERLGFIPTWLRPELDRPRRIWPVFSSAYFKGLKRRDLSALLLNGPNVMRRLQNRTPVHQSLYLWAKTNLPNYILTTLGDRMEMAHSVEGRLPFLDHEVGAYLNRMPLDMMIRGITGKYVLREATRDVVTETAYRRPKHPFLSPLTTLEPGERLRVLTEDTLRSKAVDAVPFLDARRIRGLVDRLDRMTPAERRGLSSLLLGVLSLVFMHERLGVAS